MNFETFIKSKFATFILGIGLLLVLVFSGRAVVQKYQVDKEITKLENQVAKIKKNSEQLTYLIKYLNTPEYQEKQARESLNLKKEGEFVVVLPSGSGQVGSASSDASQVSKPKQWFNYFFGAKP